ncbi:MAG TPA: glutaminase A [Dermatophilaceae bacterium]|nr:glutaminase A [Dermatophilaceae bacterium]
MDDPAGGSGTVRFVSTGSLPSSAQARALLSEARDLFAAETGGAVSTVYPALALADPGRFGLAVVATEGWSAVAGDAQEPFALMSVVKPFTYAVLCDALGPDAARACVGANATGRAFNSLAAVEAAPGGRTNPMVNAGAIATVSHLPGADPGERAGHVVAALSRYAGHPLAVDEHLLASAAATNFRNRALADALRGLGALGSDPDEAVQLYTVLCCLTVTTRDLAVMGATLADAGVNPLTGEQVTTLETCRAVLAAMTTAGMYETSGDWLHDVGLPGKSGIAGGILTVAPGKGALATWSPPLDAAGNSVRGQLAAAWLSRTLGLDLFASAPPGDVPGGSAAAS